MHPLETYEAFVIDLDGVCYLDGRLFEGVPEALFKIESTGARVVFVTNNSYRTPEAFAQMLTAGPFKADPSQVLTSSAAAARMMLQTLTERLSGKEGVTPLKPRVVAAGGKGVHDALRKVGIEPVAPEEWSDPEAPPGVVLGVDRNFNYQRLSLLSRFIREGSEFIATNEDPTYPTPSGLVPGAGAVVAAVEVASGRKARVAGKPHWPMVDLVSNQLGDAHALVVGDRWDTDLAFAHRLGFDSALVLSGVASLEDAVRSPYPPKLVAKSLPTLLDNPVLILRGPKGDISAEGGDPEIARAVQAVLSRNSESNYGSRVDPDRSSRQR